MIHGIFFDLDGTLFDTKPDILAAYRSVFQSNGIPFDPEKLRIGPPLTECLRQFMPEITPEETARMNEPGILGHGNWCWRMLPGAYSEELAEKIGRMTKLYER